MSVDVAGPGASPALALVRACHAGPTLAVTAMTGALAAAGGLAPGRAALVTAAVLTGQLSIGWSNDLLDGDRDRLVGRSDKPLATGDVSAATLRLACALALAATVVLSFLCGPVAGAVHLLTVGGGWAYNLGLKATALSWLPYAVAFGALPAFVVLAEPGAGAPPAWLPAAGALLGVGAHLVNVLPDLADDEATGIRGLPHRLGSRGASVAAVVVLGAATAIVVAATSLPPAVEVPAVAAVAALAGAALLGRGRTPFRAAIGIALVGVVLLVVAR